MCGIVGYIGAKQAYPILIKGLRRLEYRGYDSAGVAMISQRGALNVYKTIVLTRMYQAVSVLLIQDGLRMVNLLLEMPILITLKVTIWPSFTMVL